MTEVERSRGMPADSRIVFDLASDVRLMPEWLPAELHVNETDEGTVTVDGAEIRAHHDASSVEGLFGSRPEQLRVEWGSRDTPDYAGWLQVSDRSGGASEVTLHLSFLGGDTPDVPHVERLMDASLERLDGLVGRRVQQTG